MGILYIALAIACFVGLAFSYRWSDRWGANRILMAPIIGIVAAGWALASAWVLRVDLARADLSQVVIGGIIGVIFAVLIPVFLSALNRGDLSITWMVLSLSFGLTSAVILVYPGETPTPLGISGLFLVGGAVVLLGLDMRARRGLNHPGNPRKGWGFFMSLAFVMNAATQYSFKLAESMRPDFGLPHCLVYMLSFHTAVCIAGTVLAVALPRRKGSLKRACLTGASVGTCLFFGGLFVLRALSVGRVPGYLLFPATSGGNSTLVALLSVILLKERPGRFGWAGIVVGIVALVVLGLAK